MEENIKTEYALGCGRLYIAPGRAAEAEMEQSGIKAGDTDGGCILRYECRTKELYGIDGDIAAILRFGERVTVKGKLCRISPEAMEYMISGDRRIGGRGEVSVLLVCPLPGGDEFRLTAAGTAPVGAVLSAAAGGGLEFELTCGGDLSNPRLRFISGRGYA